MIYTEIEMSSVMVWEEETGPNLVGATHDIVHISPFLKFDFWIQWPLNAFCEEEKKWFMRSFWMWFEAQFKLRHMASMIWEDWDWSTRWWTIGGPPLEPTLGVAIDYIDYQQKILRTNICRIRWYISNFERPDLIWVAAHGGEQLAPRLFAQLEVWPQE